jgi:hypothetical protein
MTAAGMIELDQVLRDRLLAFVPADGTPTLAAQLTGGLWLDEAPDDVASPYGVLRVLSAPTDGDAGLRKQLLIECLLYGRQSAQRATLKRAGDVIEQALWKWVDSSAGTLVLTETAVQAVPPYQAPADRELVALRVTATAYVYLPMLTQYTT